MTGRTHDLAAITALSAVVLISPPTQITLATALIAILANQIGGIAPDIDEPTAPFWRNLPIGGFIGRIFDKMLGGHRFITHSILGVGLLGGACYFLLNFLRPIMPNADIGLVWWAFMIGIISHLIMDTLTKEGVPWFLPMPYKLGFLPVKSLRITTGEAVESFVIFPTLIVIEIYLVVSHYEQLLSLLHHQIQ
jgi:membrane-bound metal-dependent hydrolase YbcI (DUF457 family)